MGSWVMGYGGRVLVFRGDRIPLTHHPLTHHPTKIELLNETFYHLAVNILSYTYKKEDSAETEPSSFYII